MTTTPTRLQDMRLHVEITDALRELRGARAIQAHQPGHDSDALVKMAERVLDVRLARKSAAMRQQ